MFKKWQILFLVLLWLLVTKSKNIRTLTKWKDILLATFRTRFAHSVMEWEYRKRKRERSFWLPEGNEMMINYFKLKYLASHYRTDAPMTKPPTHEKWRWSDVHQSSDYYQIRAVQLINQSPATILIMWLDNRPMKESVNDHLMTPAHDLWSSLLYFGFDQEF